MNLPGLCQSCAARDVDCVNEAISIEMTSNKDGVIECSRYKFKEWGVMNYCKDCEHQPKWIIEAAADAHCESGDMWTSANHPACAVFSEKKRTCGECVHPFWRGKEGLCEEFKKVLTDLPIHIYRDATSCGDNFKGEATRKTCGGTAERGM